MAAASGAAGAGAGGGAPRLEWQRGMVPFWEAEAGEPSGAFAALRAVGDPTAVVMPVQAEATFER
eukprot:1742687-Lingulodinium_polyedra.AAC.1